MNTIKVRLYPNYCKFVFYLQKRIDVVLYTYNDAGIDVHSHDIPGTVLSRKRANSPPRAIGVCKIITKTSSNITAPVLIAFGLSCIHCHKQEENCKYYIVITVHSR